MHIRPKPWARPELNASPFFIHEPKLNKSIWHSHYLKPNAPLFLELGCGKGHFISKLAYKNPQNNYLAIDLIDAMLGLAKRNIEAIYSGTPIDNVKLTAYDIMRISDILGKEDCIEGIYINFCNPWPKRRMQKKRLTHPKQLLQYKKILKPGGFIAFKTDNDLLFEDSLEYFSTCGFTIDFVTYNLHALSLEDNILTEHEKMFSEKGILIKGAKISTSLK